MGVHLFEIKNNFEKQLNEALDMKKILCLSLLWLALCVVAVPVDARDLTWSKYNLNFAVPEGGTVGWNTSTYYEQAWEDMQLTIQLYAQDKNGSKDIYTQTLLRKAADFNMYDIKKGKVKVKDFKGYSVEGIMPNGTRCLLVNLVSKKSDLVVQVTINYLFGNREAVDDVIKSFAENKVQQPNHESKKQKIQKKQPSQASKTKEQLQQEAATQEVKEFKELKRKGVIKDI
jgi:hypothetical protein